MARDVEDRVKAIPFDREYHPEFLGEFAARQQSSRRLFLFAAPVLAALAGCTQFPELDQVTDPAVFQAPYPPLLPFEALQASTALPEPVDPAVALAARVAALRARAAALNAVP